MQAVLEAPLGGSYNQYSSGVITLEEGVPVSIMSITDKDIRFRLEARPAQKDRFENGVNAHLSESRRDDLLEREIAWDLLERYPKLRGGQPFALSAVRRVELWSKRKPNQVISP